MRVVRAERFGGPEVLVASEVVDPVAGPEQVVVAVAAADVLFLDTQLRGGWGRDFFAIEPPYVPGNGVAGQVIVGGDGIDPGWVGCQVVVRTGGCGGYAEQVVAPANALVPVPNGLDAREAAALMHDGPTALGLADGAQIRPGEWVLVVGASGGLGILLVQVAKAAGARVIGAARGPRKLGLARDLGAEAVVDYTEPDWPDRVRQATGGSGVHVVFDGVGGDIGGVAFGVTSAGGRFSAHGAPSGDFAAIDLEDAARRGVAVRGIEQVQFAPDDVKRLTERALAEAAAGRLRPIVGQTFPLDRAAEAHAAIESRSVVGKTLLLV